MPLTLLRSGIQSRRRSDQLLENLIALLQVGLFFILFLLAERLEEWGDFGMESGLILAKGIEVLGELLSEFGESALNQEGSSRGGHGGRVEEKGRKGREKEREKEVGLSIKGERNLKLCVRSLGGPTLCFLPLLRLLLLPPLLLLLQLQKLLSQLIKERISHLMLISLL